MKKYIFKHPILLTLVLVSLCLSALADVGLALVTKTIIDAITSPKAFKEALYRGGLFLMVAFLLSYLRKYWEYKYIAQTMTSLKNDIFKGHMAKDILSFGQENTATYITRVTNDMTIIESNYIQNILEIIDNIFIFTLSMGSILIINPQLSLLILVLSGLPLIFPYLFSNKLNQRKNHYSKQVGKFTATTKDLYGGYEVIKTHNAFAYIYEIFKRDNGLLEQCKFKYIILESWVHNLSESFAHLLHLSAIAMGAYLVMKGQITMGALIAILQLMSFVVGPAVQISSRFSKLYSVKDIKSKLLSPGPFTQANEAPPLDFKACLQVKDMAFSYDDKPFLSHINLTFERGKKYLIIGESGSGKSTVLKLLSRYYTPDEGVISMDGITIDRQTQDQLYENIAMIHQDVFIFDDTIKNNICLYKNYAPEALHKAIAQANLSEKIKGLPLGLDTPLREGGKILSGGERQRISIARSLIKATPILLLDEITSALDVETTLKIEATLLALEHQTLVAISHKLNRAMLKKYDQIILMGQGQVLARGSYWDLLENSCHFQTMLARASQ